MSSSGEAVKAIRATPPERFDLDEFFERVCIKEGTGPNTGVFHARAVISVLEDAVSAGEMEGIRSSLPKQFAPLFDSGSEGKMRSPH